MDSEISRLNTLKQLECPICYEHMEPPIMLCSIGHSICGSCLPRLDKCPVCRGMITSSRNIALENIARCQVYPCKYKDEGCTDLFPLCEKQIHQSECIYEPRDCPFNERFQRRCTWIGPITKMKSHIKNDHPGDFDAHDVIGRFTVCLEEFSGNKCYRAPIFTLNEAFILFFQIRDNLFFCAVMLIGPKNEASNFKFKFGLGKSNTESVSMCLKVNCFTENVESLLQAGDCVTLCFRTVAKFIGEINELQCEMEVLRNASGTIRGISTIGTDSDRLLISPVATSLRRVDIGFNRRNLCNHYMGPNSGFL